MHKIDSFKFWRRFYAPFYPANIHYWWGGIVLLILSSFLMIFFAVSKKPTFPMTQDKTTLVSAIQFLQKVPLDTEFYIWTNKNLRVYISDFEKKDILGLLNDDFFSYQSTSRQVANITIINLLKRDIKKSLEQAKLYSDFQAAILTKTRWQITLPFSDEKCGYGVSNMSGNWLALGVIYIQKSADDLTEKELSHCINKGRDMINGLYFIERFDKDNSLDNQKVRSALLAAFYLCAVEGATISKEKTPIRSRGHLTAKPSVACALNKLNVRLNFSEDKKEG